MGKGKIELISGGSFVTTCTKDEYEELISNQYAKWITIIEDDKKISIPYNNISYIVYQEN